MSAPLTLTVSTEQFEQLVSAVAERLLDRSGDRENGTRWSEWMPFDVAAACTGSTVAATRKLSEPRRVPHYEDGLAPRSGSDGRS